MLNQQDLNAPEYLRLGFSSQEEYEKWLAEEKEPLRIPITEKPSEKVAQTPPTEEEIRGYQRALMQGPTEERPEPSSAAAVDGAQSGNRSPEQMQRYWAGQAFDSAVKEETGETVSQLSRRPDQLAGFALGFGQSLTGKSADFLFDYVPGYVDYISGEAEQKPRMPSAEYSREDLTERGKAWYERGRSLGDNLPFAVASLLLFKGKGKSLERMGVPQGTPARLLGPNVGRNVQAAQMPRLLQGLGTDAAKFRQYANYSKSLEPYIKNTTFRQRLLAPTGQLYRQNPAAVTRAEAYMLGGAAVGAGVGQTFFPDDTLMILGSELVGSIFNVGAITSVAGSAISSGRRAVATLSQAGKEDMAAQVLVDISEFVGEDFNTVVVPRMREAGILTGERGVDLPAAASSQSETLRQLHSNLIRLDPRYSMETQQAYKKYENELFGMLDAMSTSGDDATVQVAAQVRQAYYENRALDALALARKDYEKAIANSGLTTNRAEANRLQKEADQLLSNTILDLNRKFVKIEDELYGPALRNLDDAFVGTPAEQAYPQFYKYLESELQSIRGMGQDVEQAVKTKFGAEMGRVLLPHVRKILGTGDSVLADTPQSVHVTAVDLGEFASNSKNGNLQRLGYGMRRALLNDLNTIDDPALNDAIAFSRAGEQVFSESWVARALPPNVASKVQHSPYGTFLSGAASASGETIRERLSTIQRVSSLFDLPEGGGPEAITREVLDSVGSPEATAIFESLRSYEQQFLFARASELLNEEGLVDPRRLSAFRTKYASVLQDFPELDTALRNVDSARLAFDNVATAGSKQNIQTANESLFKALAEAGAKKYNTNINTVLPNAILKNPETSTSALSELATGVEQWSKYLADKNLLNGLDGSATKTAVKHGATGALYRGIIEKNTSDGVINYTAVKNDLFDALPGRNYSMMDLMRKNKLINEVDYKNAEEMFSLASTRFEAATTAAQLGKLIEDPDIMMSLVTRGIFSSQITQSARRLGILQGGAGPSLIVAEGAARIGDKLIGLDVKNGVVDILIRAQYDSQLRERLIVKAGKKTPAELERQYRGINATLYGIGLTSDISERDRELYKTLFISEAPLGDRMERLEFYQRPRERQQ